MQFFFSPGKQIYRAFRPCLFEWDGDETNSAVGLQSQKWKTHFKILLVTNGLYVRVCTTLHCRVKWNGGLGRILKQCKSGAIFSAKKALLAYLFLQKNTKSKNYFTNLYNSFQKLFHSNYLKFVFYSHHQKGYFCKTHYLAMQLSWDIFTTFDQFDDKKTSINCLWDIIYFLWC